VAVGAKENIRFQKRRPCCRSSGFTLIELLVAVGIIGLLMALLMPMVTHMREAARRAEDLADLHQLTTACMLYSQDHDGLLPAGKMAGDSGGIGSGPGVYKSVQSAAADTGDDPDDYTWINYKDCWRPLLDLVPGLAKMNSCTSIRDFYDPSVVETFGKPQTALNYPNDTRLGWIYWGGRDDLKGPDGQLAYRSMRRHGQHLTPGSQTLWTCWCWDSNGIIGASACPHIGSHCASYAIGVPLKPPPDGLAIGLDDGSAAFINWTDMIIIPQGNGWKLYYEP